MEQYFLQFPFFKKLAQENDQETLTSCCKHMKLSTHQRNETVFSYGKSPATNKQIWFGTKYIGDTGTLFYIIVEGQVALKIPTFLEAPEMSLEDLYVFMMENETEINWEALQMMLEQGSSSPMQTTQTI